MKQTEMLRLLWQVVNPWHQTPQPTTPMYAIDIGMVILIHTTLLGFDMNTDL